MAFNKKFDKNKRPRRPTQSALFKRKRVCRFTAEGVEQIDYKDIDTLRDFVTETGKIIPAPSRAPMPAISVSSPRRLSVPAFSPC